MFTILYFITIIKEKQMKWILMLIIVGLIGLIAYKPITDIQSCLMKTINFEKNTSSSTS